MSSGISATSLDSGAAQARAPLQLSGRLLEVRNLKIAFDSRTILSNANFALESKASLAIIGPNGSGKTLLLKALLGLLPCGGEIRWRSGIRPGYVPQKISADPSLPLLAGELLRAKAKVMHLTETQVREATTWSGVNNLLDQRVGTLSSGQLQRLLIAFALAGAPDVLLVDEPTSSLDELAEEHIFELINRIRLERGTALVLVSHDLTLVRGSATHVLCVAGGEALFGTASEMLVPEVLQHVYRAPVEFHMHHMGQQRGGRE